MTHSTLLRVFSHLGFRASRKIFGSNSIPVFPSPIPVFAQSRIQSRDCPSIVACLPMGQDSSSIRGYGSADENRSKEGSVDSANASQDEQKPKLLEVPEAETDLNPKVSANVSQDEQRPSAEKLLEVPETETDLNPKVSANVSQDEQKPSAENLLEVPEAETDLNPKVSANVSQDEQKPSAEELVEVPEAVVSPEQAHKLETDLNPKASKPEDTKKEDEDEAEKALKLALEELGEPPERPLAGDCCGQGCDVCVWDTYNDELRDYLARKKELLKKSK